MHILHNVSIFYSVKDFKNSLNIQIPKSINNLKIDTKLNNYITTNSKEKFKLDKKDLNFNYSQTPVFTSNNFFKSPNVKDSLKISMKNNDSISFYKNDSKFIDSKMTEKKNFSIYNKQNIIVNSDKVDYKDQNNLTSLNFNYDDIGKKNISLKKPFNLKTSMINPKDMKLNINKGDIKNDYLKTEDNSHSRINQSVKNNVSLADNKVDIKISNLKNNSYLVKSNNNNNGSKSNLNSKISSSNINKTNLISQICDVNVNLNSVVNHSKTKLNSSLYDQVTEKEMKFKVNSNNEHLKTNSSINKKSINNSNVTTTLNNHNKNKSIPDNFMKFSEKMILDYFKTKFDNNNNNNKEKKKESNTQIKPNISNYLVHNCNEESNKNKNNRFKIEELIQQNSSSNKSSIVNISDNIKSSDIIMPNSPGPMSFLNVSNNNSQFGQFKNKIPASKIKNDLNSKETNSNISNIVSSKVNLNPEQSNVNNLFNHKRSISNNQSNIKINDKSISNLKRIIKNLTENFKLDKNVNSKSKSKRIEEIPVENMKKNVEEKKAKSSNFYEESQENLLETKKYNKNYIDLNKISNDEVYKKNDSLNKDIKNIYCKNEEISLTSRYFFKPNATDESKNRCITETREKDNISNITQIKQYDIQNNSIDVNKDCNNYKKEIVRKDSALKNSYISQNSFKEILKPINNNNNFNSVNPNHKKSSTLQINKNFIKQAENKVSNIDMPLKLTNNNINKMNKPTNINNEELSQITQINDNKCDNKNDKIYVPIKLSNQSTKMKSTIGNINLSKSHIKTDSTYSDLTDLELLISGSNNNKDEKDYFKIESEKLSTYIKQYHKAYKKYPYTKIQFYKYGRVRIFLFYSL